MNLEYRPSVFFLFFAQICLKYVAHWSAFREIESNEGIKYSPHLPPRASTYAPRAPVIERGKGADLICITQKTRS